ncbi:ecdysteroid kinase domain-containing protein [Phthorimaea operculella]|nr:ecdysteroid kinase domain-containing protein [Phthorimaea operculella]
MADAETILRDEIAKIAKEHDFNNYDLAIKPISSGGANYTSVLFLVTVKSPGKKDVELFAKVASMGEHMREMLNAKKMYHLEVFFYTKLSKVYRSLELKANVAEKDRLAVPKFYGCKTDLYEETLILQNLTAEGFKLHNRREPVSWEYAASAFENLAKFHALSFAYQKENPEEFEEVCKDLVFVEFNQDDAMKDMNEKQMQETIEIVRNPEYRSRVAKLLQDLVEDDGLFMFKKPLGTKVIVHGDFRSDNMMYREKSNEVEVIILDYQTMHIGCPAADIMYFVASATDSAFRAKYYERLINHYYEELSAAMRRLGVDPEKAYSRKLFDSELKQMMPMFLTLSMFLLRLVLVDADKAPKTDGGAGMEAFSALPPTGAFAERFNGAVEDCVRWGVI